MTTYTIHSRLPRAELAAALRALPAMFAGRVADPLGMVHGFKMRLAAAFLEKIKESFIVKAGGGTDECGDSWPPLSKAYLAYGRRFVPGEQVALKKAAGLGKGHRHAPGGRQGLLSQAQLDRWRQVFARNMRWLEKRYGQKQAENIAAAIAWKDAKAHGAKTKLEVYGNRKVDILRDTGVLLNSLSPGEVSGSGADAGYSPPANQIVSATPGELIVGTNVRYARAHQLGKRVPLRRILPAPASVPQSWLSYFGRQATSGFVAAMHLIARAA